MMILFLFHYFQIEPAECLAISHFRLDSPKSMF